MSHGIVDVFAYQEALLIEAVFGVVLLTMIWVGFRKWLQSKERASRLVADQTAEHHAQFGALIERVEARLNAIERIVTDGRDEARAQLKESSGPEVGRISKPDQVGTKQ